LLPPFLSKELDVPGEDGGVHGAAVVVNDGEGGTGVLGHGNTVPKYKLMLGCCAKLMNVLFGIHLPKRQE
jgi:hypothetical protein